MNSWNILGHCFYLNMRVLADQEKTFRIYLDEENKFKILVPQGIFCTLSVLKSTLFRLSVKFEVHVQPF